MTQFLLSAKIAIFCFVSTGFLVIAPLPALAQTTPATSATASITPNALPLTPADFEKLCIKAGIQFTSKPATFKKFLSPAAQSAFEQQLGAKLVPNGPDSTMLPNAKWYTVKSGNHEAHYFLFLDQTGTRVSVLRFLCREMPPAGATLNTEIPLGDLMQPLRLFAFPQTLDKKDSMVGDKLLGARLMNVRLGNRQGIIPSDDGKSRILVSQLPLDGGRMLILVCAPTEMAASWGQPSSGGMDKDQLQAIRSQIPNMPR